MNVITAMLIAVGGGIAGVILSDVLILMFESLWRATRGRANDL